MYRKKKHFKCFFVLIMSRSVKTVEAYLGDTVGLVPDTAVK